MLSFLFSKTKVQSYDISEISIKNFEILGIAQINPYCHTQYDNEVYFTIVNFANETNKFDERECVVPSKYFISRRCPKCRRVELIPTRIKLNMDREYLRNEEEVAFDAYSEYPSRTNTPSTIKAYCKGCDSCFDIRIKTKDYWIKQAKKIRPKDIIIPWEEYQVDMY